MMPIVENVTMKRPLAGDMFTVECKSNLTSLQFEMPESEKSEIDFEVYTASSLAEEVETNQAVMSILLRITFT